MGYFFHNQAFLLHKKAILPMSISSFSCILLNALFSYYGALEHGVIGVLVATIGAFLTAAIISALFISYFYRRREIEARAAVSKTT